MALKFEYIKLIYQYMYVYSILQTNFYSCEKNFRKVCKTSLSRIFLTVNQSSIVFII